jgi:hypothetical protein
MSDTQLTDDQKRLLAAVLDEIIPQSADGQLPGAGELGLAGRIDQALLESPELRPVVAQGLEAVEALAVGRDAAGFSALSPADRKELLEEVSTTQPGLLPSLVFHTYVAYYQEPRVLEALGFEARPPYPKGYEVEDTDFTLLDPVRQRSRS